MKTEHNPGRYATLLTPLSRDAADRLQELVNELNALKEQTK